jgi:ABC-2 type transport system ATP-binding protein
MNNVSPIVECRGLIKSFDGKKAIDSVDLSIMPGSIIGLLGPNGCGKSTLLRHMIGIYLPDKGSCTTYGCDAGKLTQKELSRIGYVHQEGELLDWMTVEQLIRYVEAFHHQWNSDLEKRYVKDFELNRDSKVGALSPGQRQKLSILLAIGHEPDFLILDEPASSLDPIARSQFLDLLISIIQQEPKTILISSHILSDVEKVIDHVIIMKNGKVIENRSFDDLRDHYMRVKVTSLGASLPEKLPFDKILSCQQNNGQAVLILENPDVDSIKNSAESINCRIDFNALPLEDIYKIIMEETV